MDVRKQARSRPSGEKVARVIVLILALAIVASYIYFGDFDGDPPELPLPANWLP